jgi:hypothetical protein
MGQPVCDATLQLRRYVVPRLGEFFDLLGKRRRQLVLGSAHVKCRLAIEERREVLGSINLLGQRERDDVAEIGRRTTFRGSQCRSKRDLQACRCGAAAVVRPATPPPTTRIVSIFVTFPPIAADRIGNAPLGRD